MFGLLRLMCKPDDNMKSHTYFSVIIFFFIPASIKHPAEIDNFAFNWKIARASKKKALAKQGGHTAQIPFVQSFKQRLNGLAKNMSIMYP